MAAVSTALAVATGAVGLGKGIYDMNQGKKLARQAQESIDNYAMPRLTNAYAGMAVPTQGATMAAADAARSQAEASHLVSQGGARSAIGGASSVAESTRETMARIGADLTSSEFNLKNLMAQDESRIQGLKENRAQADLAGLGAQRAYGQSQKDAGLSSIVSTGASLAEMSMDTAWGDKKLWGEGAGASGISKPGYTKPAYSTGNSNKGI